VEALHALGINLPSLMWHTVNFILLVILLSKFLYRPVVKMLDERAARVKESMERAETIKEQLIQTGAETKRQLEAARKEAQAIVDQANQMAQAVKLQARQEAQVEADKIVEKARTQLEQERELAVAEMRRDVADMVIAAATKVVSQSMDGKAQRRLVQEFIGDNSQN